MTQELVVELLPACHGDAILLEWPDPSSADHPTRRMLVDCGPARAYTDIANRLRELEPRHIDLLVLTHVDADHIEGMILAVNDAAVGLDVDEVWFNGYPQLAAGELAAPHGEILGALICQRGIPWNAAFDKRAAKASSDGQLLSRVVLPGGLAVTVLGPAEPDLTALLDHWKDTCDEAGLTVGSVGESLRLLQQKRNLLPDDAYLSSYLSAAPIPDVEQLAQDRRGNDTKIPNRSSIVLLAEYHNRSVLLAGDSTPSVLHAALLRVLDERGVDHLELTDFKVPHHGSAKNISRQILELAPAERYLFSTDGSYFGHPDDTAVASVIRYGSCGAELVFNYGNPRTRQWNLAELREQYHYRARYPEAGMSGIRLEG
jgi:beta-lactamase superfamily II metal-dependent hydrolase